MTDVWISIYSSENTKPTYGPVVTARVPKFKRSRSDLGKAMPNNTYINLNKYIPECLMTYIKTFK